MPREPAWGLLLFLVACEPPAPGKSPPPRAPRVAEPLLKPDALLFRVKSVYDGDTLTLENGKKVRLLAVDTPELKEKQPLAPEARDFTKRRCEDKTVRLEFDTEKEDRYGRWLCYVYAPDEAGAEKMVNAELLRAGLARFYTPGANLKYAEMLLACQREARENSRGTWKDYVLAKPRAVVATPSGKAYHRPDCKFVQNSRDLLRLSDKEALDRGLSACRECKP
jgi:endonuclease YncB( thermonuclease family)